MICQDAAQAIRRGPVARRARRRSLLEEIGDVALELPSGRAHHAKDAIQVEQEIGRASGIGNPVKFFATIAEASIEARIHRRYVDHHRYRADEAAALTNEAVKQNAGSKLAIGDR